MANTILQTTNNPLLKPESIKLAHSNSTIKKMFNGTVTTNFGNAGWNDFGKERYGFLGWMGLGGSVMQWHPKKNIAFAYTMNKMEITPDCIRARNLQKTIINCIDKYNI